MRTTQNETIKRSDLDALNKVLKENSSNNFCIFLNASTCDTAVNVVTSSRLTKPLVIYSEGSHHMVSDLNLISNIVPALENVMIANGKSVPIKGISDLRLFDKDSKAFYMPTFTSNLLYVKRVTTDLNCYYDVYFKDIDSSRLLGKSINQNRLELT